MKKTLRFCLVAAIVLAVVLGISSVAFAATNDGSISILSGGKTGAIGRDVEIKVKAPSSLPKDATSDHWHWEVFYDGSSVQEDNLDPSSSASVTVTVDTAGTHTVKVAFSDNDGNTYKYSKKTLTLGASNSLLSLSQNKVAYKDGLLIKVSITNPVSDGLIEVDSGDPLQVMETTKGLSEYTILVEDGAKAGGTYTIEYNSTSLTYTQTVLNIKPGTGDKTYLIKAEVIKKPTKMYYKVGETFDPTGMIIRGSFGPDTSTPTSTKTFTVDDIVYESHKYNGTESNGNGTGYYDILIRVAASGYKALDGTDEVDYLEISLTTECEEDTTAAEVKSVELSKASMKLARGTSFVLKATAYPESAVNAGATFTFKCNDNPSVVKISQDGDTAVITALGEKDGNGKYIATDCTIVVKVEGADGSSVAKAKCYIVIPADGEVTNITISPKSFKLLNGDTTTLTCSVKPSDLENPVIVWNSSNPEVCTVNNSGQITGVKEGTALITATCYGMSSSTTVTVVDKISDVVKIVNCKKGVNCRGSASGSGKIIGTAYLDSEYKLLGQSGSWYKIQYTSSKVGYVYKTFVESSDGKKYKPDNATPAADPNATPAPTSSSKVTIINCLHRVYIKASASSSAKTLGYAELGTTWSLKGKTSDGAWYVVDKDGTNGYIQSKFCLVG